MKDGFLRLLYTGSLLVFCPLAALLGLHLFPDLPDCLVFHVCLFYFLCRFHMILVLVLSKSEVLEQGPRRFCKS